MNSFNKENNTDTNRTFSQNFWDTDKVELFGRDLIYNRANDIVNNLKPTYLGNKVPKQTIPNNVQERTFGQNFFDTDRKELFGRVLGNGIPESTHYKNVPSSILDSRIANPYDYNSSY